MLPLCSVCKMASIEDIVIPREGVSERGSEGVSEGEGGGHGIGATVYTPVSQVCSEIKRPIVIHM
jgi:hypothetical protein